MEYRQHTLRKVPQRIDELLRQRAAADGVSLNRAAIEALARGLGATAEKTIYHDLDDLAGKWEEDPEFDAAIASMDVVDEEAWR